MKHHLVLVRHAHRDTDAGRLVDNGLSEKGLHQAANIAAYFLNRFGDDAHDFQIFTSPKLRCVQTVQPLAATVNKKVQLEDDLIEQHGYESNTDFVLRVQNYGRLLLNQLTSDVILCSHGDWIPVFLETFYSQARIHCKKGSWTEFEVSPSVGLILHTVVQGW